jgi:hypothetical protein
MLPCFSRYVSKQEVHVLVQSKVLVSTEMCPQLPTMVNQHFDTLKQLNQMLNEGKDIDASSSVPVRRLLQAAQNDSDTDSSAICRFFPEENMYMADPAIEGRIRRIGS